MGDEAHLAKLASGTVTLGQCQALCPSVSPHSATGSEVHTQDWEDMPPFSKCQSSLSPPSPSFCRPWTPRPREAQWPALGGTARQGHIRMWTPDPGTSPTHMAPQLPQEDWRMVGGPGARRQRLAWGAAWPLAPPPPRHPGLAPSTGRPAAGTSAQAQTSIHTRALAPSFSSALLFPPQLTSFFPSSLSSNMSLQ